MLLTLKFFLNQLQGKSTVAAFDLLGRRLTLNISARRELKRARAIDREQDLVAQLSSTLRDGDTFYDVGANIGLISLLVAHEPDRALQSVHSFEPEPRNFAQLQKNIALNNDEALMTANQLALGAEEGEVTLHTRGTAGDGRHSISESKGATDAIKVPLTTMSAYAKKTDSWPDVIKIDVEGAEGQVLAGMEELITTRPPRDLIMEIHGKGEGDKMPNGDNIHAWLEAHGYAKVWQHGRSFESHVHYQLKPSVA